MKARNEAEHKMKAQDGRLKQAKERIAQLERELRAERDRTARLEASLEMAGAESGGEKTTEAGKSLTCR